MYPLVPVHTETGTKGLDGCPFLLYLIFMATMDA
jgi:hypothetical protein